MSLLTISNLSLRYGRLTAVRENSRRCTPLPG